MFAVVTQGESCRHDLFYGTDYHTHLGTEFGGMATMDDELISIMHRIKNSQFKSEFDKELHLYQGQMGIGVISPKDEQPLIINPHNGSLGMFVICGFGLIEDAQDQVQYLRELGVHFRTDKDHQGNESINNVKLMGSLIGLGDNLVDGIQKAFERIEGSMSVMILNADGIYVARSLFGHSPLFLGQNKKTNSTAVTLEPTAFPNLGYEPIRPLHPGEIIFISPKTGLEDIDHGQVREQICAFWWVYSGFPAFEYEGLSAEKYREITGGNLYLRDIQDNLRPRVAAGIADSGTTYAIGYAAKSKHYVAETIRDIMLDFSSGLINERDLAMKISDVLECLVDYRRPIVKYTQSWGRSYTPTTQEMRDLIASMKQIPVRDILREIDELVITEDSIVRGTQLQRYLVKLRQILIEIYGDKVPKMHVRVGCPPLGWPCKYMLSTRTKGELAARRAVKQIEDHEISDTEMREYLDPKNKKYNELLKAIAQELDVDTVRYQTLEEMVQAIGLPPERVCTHCWTGC